MHFAVIDCNTSVILANPVCNNDSYFHWPEGFINQQNIQPASVVIISKIKPIKNQFNNHHESDIPSILSQ